MNAYTGWIEARITIFLTSMPQKKNDCMTIILAKFYMR